MLEITFSNFGAFFQFILTAPSCGQVNQKPVCYSKWREWLENVNNIGYFANQVSF